MAKCKCFIDGDNVFMTKKLDFGILAKARLELSLFNDKDNKYHEISGWLDVDDENYHVSKEINYCPMCGRKLSEDEL